MFSLSLYPYMSAGNSCMQARLLITGYHSGLGPFFVMVAERAPLLTGCELITVPRPLSHFGSDGTYLWGSLSGPGRRRLYRGVMAGVHHRWSVLCHPRTRGLEHTFLDRLTSDQTLTSIDRMAG